MLEIDNKPPFAANLTPLTQRDGIDVVAVYLAASFQSLNSQWLVCDKQTPAPLADEYWDDEKPSSVKYPGQLSFDKPLTDLIINGTAISPNQVPTPAIAVAAQIGDRNISMHVYGERVWNHGQVTRPEPFMRLPLTWENAYGGSELVEGEEESFACNPYGKGWMPDGSEVEAFNGKPLPNIEWPDQLIYSTKQQPSPAGFAASSPHMPSRAQYTGTYDAAWQQQQAPFLPSDFNSAFFNAAVPAFQLPSEQLLGQPLRLLNLNATSDITINLPTMGVSGEAIYNNSKHSLIFKLLTVLVESENLIVRLYWQAIAPVPRTLADLKVFRINLAR